MVRERARKGLAYVTVMLRQCYGNDMEQSGGDIVMISERFMRKTDNSRKGSERGVCRSGKSVRRKKKATAGDGKNYFLVLFAYVKKKS